MPAQAEQPPQGGDARMTLLEHLGELRKRLGWIVLAVAILGGASLYFSRDLFELLMRPVLAALPDDSRQLIYTSGIEEINVLLKVGLYAGLFLSSPVVLYQLWRFVAPGLYVNERRLVLPFVSLGTLFFLGGAVFCYFAVLPTMFKFLLTEADEHEVHARAARARAQEADASKLLALGEKGDALPLITAAQAALDRSGDGQVRAPADVLGHPVSLAEVKASDALLQHHLDTGLNLVARGGSGAHAALRAALLAHDQAALAMDGRRPEEAARALDEAASALGKVYGGALGEGYGEAFAQLWRLDRHLGAAARREADIEWTRPMLTMSEQLSLVLLLEVAFGVIFEMPLIMTLLAWLGLVKAAWLAKYQRHAVLLCVVAAAVITPSGDAINLSLMALPMIVCYELGLLGAWIVGRRREAKPTLTPVE